MNFFKDKVIWITGASSGIGEALAYELSARGARLILSARRENELKRVQEQLPNKAQAVLLLPFDLMKKENFPAVVNAAVSQFGKVDVLVNNGGYSQRSLALDTPEEIERELMEVNFFSYTALSKLVLPQMIKNGYGQLVVMSSIAGKFGFFYRSSYSAAKHALHGYFESLRLENYEQNIHVLLVCPGKIKTNVSLNAVTANGGTHRRMDKSHEEAMSPQQCAKQIADAMAKHKEELYVGGKELKAVWLKRFFPHLFSKLIRKQTPE
jgi:dehydrogenase/reductase SDR family member 7B